MDAVDDLQVDRVARGNSIVGAVVFADKTILPDFFGVIDIHIQPEFAQTGELNLLEDLPV